MSPPGNPQPTTQPATLPMLLLMVVLNVIGFGVVIPLLPYFANAFDAPPWQVALMFATYSAGQFAGELLWGPVSDHVGRRPVLLITTLGMAVFTLALAFAPGIGIAILLRLGAGFFAGNMSVIQSYIVDVSPPERLAARLGYIGSAFGIGFVVGPAVGGLMAHPEMGSLGFRPPLILAAALAALAAVGMLAFVRESRSGLRTAGQRRSPFAALGEALGDPVLAPTFAAIVLSFFAFSGLWAVLGLWGDAKFGWSAREFGLVMAATGLAAAVTQGLLTATLMRWIGAGPTIAVSLVLAGLAFAFMGLSPWGWLAIIFLNLAMMGHAGAQPACSALVSRSASADRQGETLGAASAVGSLARVFGPIAGGALYSGIRPDAPIVLAGLAMLPAAWMGWKAGRAYLARTLQ